MINTEDLELLSILVYDKIEEGGVNLVVKISADQPIKKENSAREIVIFLI